MIYYNFIGVDVSKDKFNVCLTESSNCHSKIFKNSKIGFKEFLNWIKKNTGHSWVCMEATGIYSEELAEYLCEHKIRVSVVNPLQIKSFIKSKLARNKNDIIDAKMIAEYASTMQPRIFQPRSKNQKELRDLMKLLGTFKRQKIQLENQYRSIRGSIAKNESKKFINMLERKITKLTEKLISFVDQHQELSETINLITTIKGIGVLTACNILAYIPNISLFANAKQFAAFMGLTPRQHQSGSVCRKSSISRIGNAKLRESLYFPALVAKRHNEHLQGFVNRLQNNGLAPKAIVCAVMRKLAHLIFGILKNRLPFNHELV